MKFVAVALTVLLAVAAQATDVQSDAPSQMEHFRAASMVYLTQVKESAMKTLEHLDGTDYSEYKVKLSDSLDQLYNYAQTASQSLTPYGDAFTTQFLEATKEVREKVVADVEELRTQLEPKREELHQVLQKHVEDYRAKLEPIFQQYATKNKAEMEALRAKLQPVLDEMRTKVEANVEETKSKIMPIVEVVRTKMTERLEELRTMAAPYAEEYKEQLTKAFGKVKEEVAPHAKDLQGKLEPYAEYVRNLGTTFYENIVQAFQS